LEIGLDAKPSTAARIEIRLESKWFLPSVEKAPPHD
jgi:hypothetical protein